MIKKKSSKNIIKIAVIVGVVIIPLLYSFFYLGAFWDPYARLDDVPVAVVNLDKGATINDTDRNVGDEVCDTLKENGTVKFCFVSKDAADKGLKGDKYYAEIVIPDNFSENISAVSKDTEKIHSEIQYISNQKKNYLAAQILENAMPTIKESVNSSIDEEIITTLCDKLNSVPEDMGELQDGLKKLDNGATKFSDGTGTLDNGASDLKDGTSTLCGGTSTLTTGLAQFKEGTVKLSTGASDAYDGAAKLSDGTKTLKDGTAKLKASVPTLSDGVKQLSSGGSTLATSTKQYTDGVASVKDGAKQLNNKSSQLKSGATQVSAGSASLSTGITEVQSGLNTMSGTLADSVNDENGKQIQTVSAGLTSLDTGIDTLNDTLQNAKDSTLEAELTEVQGGLTSVGANTLSAGTHLAEMQATLQSMQNADWFKALDSTTQQQILTSLGTSMAEIKSDLTEIGKSTTSAGTSLGKAANSAQEISDSVDNVKDGVKQIATKADALLPASSQLVTKLYGGLSTVKTSVDTQLIPGVSLLGSGANALSTGATTLSAGVNQYTDGVGTLYSGVSTLDSNSTALSTGAKVLAGGLEELKGKVPTLSDGVNSLDSGASDLKSGSSALADGIKKVADGASTVDTKTTEIKDGADTLNSGAIKLNNGVATLKSGAVSLKSGASELATGIKTAKDGVDDTVSDTNEQLKALVGLPEYGSEPVTYKASYIQPVDNYGSAFAPYFMGLSLWVGGLMIFFGIYLDYHKKIRRLSKAAKNTTYRFFCFAGISVIQAVFLAIVIQFLLGITVNNPLLLYVACIVTSLTFMSIIQFLLVHLDDIGKFLALFLLILQLTSCGGTFPIETESIFYQALFNFMPMTYSTQLFKEAISGTWGTNAARSLITLICIMVVFGVATIALSAIKKRRGSNDEYDFNADNSNEDKVLA